MINLEKFLSGSPYTDRKTRETVWDFGPRILRGGEIYTKECRWNRWSWWAASTVEKGYNVRTEMECACLGKQLEQFELFGSPFSLWSIRVPATECNHVCMNYNTATKKDKLVQHSLFKSSKSGSASLGFFFLTQLCLLTQACPIASSKTPKLPVRVSKRPLLTKCVVLI